MRKLDKTIVFLVLVAITLPWLVENCQRLDPRLTYNGEIFDPMRTEEYNAEVQAGADYVHLVTEDGLAVPMILGNSDVECREVHMMVDGQELLLRFENNHLIEYTPAFKGGLEDMPDSLLSYALYKDYGTMLDLF